MNISKGAMLLAASIAIVNPALAASRRGNARAPELGSLYYTRLIVSPDCMIEHTGAQAGEGRVFGLLVGPLLSIIAPLVSTGIDLITSRFKVNEEDYSASDSGLASSFFYDTSRSQKAIPLNYCITIVRGDFSGAHGVAVVQAWANALGTALQQPVSPDDVDLLGLADRPDLYAEFWIRYNEVPAAFQVVPMVIDYHKSMAKRTGDNGKLVTFAFRFDALQPGDESNSATFAQLGVPALRLHPGTLYGPAALEGVTSGYYSVPAQANFGKGTGSQELSSTPINVITTVSEAEKPSELARMVSQSAVAIGAALKPSLTSAAEAVATKGNRERGQR